MDGFNPTISENAFPYRIQCTGEIDIAYVDAIERRRCNTGYGIILLYQHVLCK